MRKLLVPASAALLALSCSLHPTHAKADTFLLTASSPATAYDPAISLTATLTGVADPNVSGEYYIIGGTGTLNGAAVTIYSNPGATPGSVETSNFSSPPFTYNTSYTYDNILYTSGNGGLALDEDGLLFASATDHFNPFIQGPDYVFTNDETVNGFNAPLTNLTVTSMATGVTPEPSSLALLGTGLLGTMGIVRRRFQA